MFENFRRHLEKRISINNAEFDFITKKITVKTFKKKEVILKAGDVCKFQYYINRGCVRMYHTDEKGHEHVVLFGFDDWWTGDIMSFVTGQPADYSIEALEETEMLMMDRDDMEWLYAQIPKLERFFRILIQNAFVASQQRMISNMSKSAEERYLMLLKKFPQIELKVTQHHIASYLGITPEALSRTKKSLIEKSRS